MNQQNLQQDVSIFNNPLFRNVEVLNINGKFYFPASKVAAILGYKDPDKAVRTHCLEDGGAFHPLIDNLGRIQNTKIIDEGNLYRLIVKSQLPLAQQFERWIFDEVLPLIRQTGMYMTDSAYNAFVSNPRNIANIMNLYADAKGQIREM